MTGPSGEILQKRLPRLAPVRYSWRWFTGKGQFVGVNEYQEENIESLVAKARKVFQEVVERYKEETLEFPFKYYRPLKARGSDDLRIMLFM